MPEDNSQGQEGYYNQPYPVAPAPSTAQETQTYPDQSQQAAPQNPEQDYSNLPTPYPSEAYPTQTQDSYSQGYSQDSYSSQYPSSSSGVSTDIITEIAEQLMDEKLSDLNETLQSILKMKTTLETTLSSLSDRITRVEKILDTLQLSILQKVGEYVSDVSDIKHELQETQKSFKSIHSRSHKKK